MIRKPWRTACLNSSLPLRLNKCCTGLRPRLPCEGRDTMRTQEYTPSICHIIAETVKIDARGKSRGACCVVLDLEDAQPFELSLIHISEPTRLALI
eukprot:9265038-Alexandrium_andersonii.AAC.1